MLPISRPARRPHRLPLTVYGSAGLAFSVTIGTSPRSPVFADVDFGRECLALLANTLERSASLNYAHCLMPDHVHLLIGVGSRSCVDVISEWKARCYHARRRRGDPRSFWQRSFWDQGLRGNERLVETALYILHNPVRAGLAERWRDYPLCGSSVWDL